MIKRFTFLLACGLLFLSGHSQVFNNGQNAHYAFSATSLSTTGILATTDSTFTSPVAQVCMVADPKHKCIYVSDMFGQRVLRFAYPVIKNMPVANLVLGQPNFTTAIANNGGISASSFNYPSGLAIDTISGTLWVSDMSNNRVLRFDSAYKITTNNTNANQVIGQPSFTVNSGALTQAGITFNNSPQTGGLINFDHNTGALWVSDNGNSRVLRYDNAKTKPNGANADAVLGQTLFTTNTTGLSATQFNRPDGITTVGSSLFVSDVINHRVLRFDNVYAKANGAAADAVLGQTSFVSNTAGVTATTFNQPTGLTSDANSLYVTELGNKRVLIFNSAVTNTVASNVLLASNFTTVGSGALSPSTGGANSTIYMEPILKQLFVQDRTNKRILVFNGCAIPMISGINSFCSGAGTNTATLTASGANTYSWNTGATTAAIIVTPTVTTVYSVAVTSTISCIISNPVNFTVSIIPTPTLNVSGPSAICMGQIVTLGVSGASTYTWSTGSTSSSIAVSPTVATGYTITGSNSGCTKTNTLTLAVNSNPTVSAVGSSSLICPGQTSTLTASGASTYSWNNGGSSPSIVVSPTATSNYTVIGTSAAGCASTFTLSQSVSPCTGIQMDLALATGISLYPNPSNGLFFVRVNAAGSDIKMQILNILGQVIHEQQINTTVSKVDLINEAAGIYIVKISESNGLMFKANIIKQ